jgi:hypothetical protein
MESQNPKNSRLDGPQNRSRGFAGEKILGLSEIRNKDRQAIM